MIFQSTPYALMKLFTIYGVNTKAFGKLKMTQNGGFVKQQLNSPTGPKCFKQNVFGDVLDRKQPFLDNTSINLSKKLGLVYSFGQKCEISSSFLFKQSRPKKSVCDVLERKLALLDHKNIEFRIFATFAFFQKVIPWFWLKMRNFFILSFKAKSAKKVCEISSSFLLRQNRATNTVWWPSRQQAMLAFLDYKSNHLRKQQNLHFAKRVSPWSWFKM